MKREAEVENVDAEEEEEARGGKEEEEEEKEEEEERGAEERWRGSGAVVCSCTFCELCRTLFVVVS